LKRTSSREISKSSKKASLSAKKPEPPPLTTGLENLSNDLLKNCPDPQENEMDGLPHAFLRRMAGKRKICVLFGTRNELRGHPFEVTKTLDHTLGTLRERSHWGGHKGCNPWNQSVLRGSIGHTNCREVVYN